MRKQPLLVLGAKSDIAIAVALRFAKEGYPLQFAARNVETLKEISIKIRTRYKVSVSLHEFDVLNIRLHGQFIDSLPEMPSIALCSVGYLGQQISDNHEFNIKDASLIIRTNFEGPASIFSELANRFVNQGHGILIGISSVAGERGRQSN